MKKYSLIFFIIITNSCLAQIDTLSNKIDSLYSRENRFKVAGSVLKNVVLSVPGDFSEMGHTISSDWKRTAYYTAGIIGLIATDKITTGFLHDHIEPAINYSLPKRDYLNTNITGIGGNNNYILYPIMGLYVGSFAINNKKGQTVATNAMKSIVYSYVISHLVLKTITGRNRPQRRINDNEPIIEPWTKNNWDFGNFHKVYTDSKSDGTAFPSFHATFYYAVAKVFQMEYNNYWIPYTIATGVFLSDIKGHNHWVSDILVGGLVGTIIGKSIVISSRKQIEKDKNTALIYNPRKFRMSKQLIPQISSSMIGFHFVGSF
ncbi:phosphatase PAP2 family protein [Flavobacterium cellulosilyticum]|uniref:Phosphatase PAP2 family protein n=1 Tax=Flavobacterium cellulosilyticum TaxID=2541731 RepID=A0A4R5CFI0_9FLAO|nr:phosphatase PAP2 family protein [Flavobacterium cellulosilyticum]TDD95994.1 phosphatase PAP2 family protein [Flavobacterium cellulosilyticum]